MEMLSYVLDFNNKLFISLAVDVKNTGDVLKLVLKGDVKCALINPKLIIDIFQVAVAANKAVIACESDKLITKNLYTEIIYNLSPSKNITSALKEFGIQDTDDTFLVCVVDNYGICSEKLFKDVCNKIDGVFKVPSSSELNNISDENYVTEHYKISVNELKVSSLLDSVVTRISSKGFK